MSQGSRTPRGDDAPTPRRARGEGNQTPRQGNRTPARDDPSRTPRHQRTPATNDAIDTPMRWGGPRRPLDGENEIPASPAHSLGASSPGGGII